MKIKLLSIALILCTISVIAQSQKELANKYLEHRGELVFRFTANNLIEVRELANIISFDHGQDHGNPLTIKAIANKKNFSKFLKYNLKYEVNIAENEPKDVVMFTPEIHKKGTSGKINNSGPLSFPLSAYPTYQQYADQMAAFEADHSDIAELVDIGGTVQGVSGGDKRLLFIKLSDNISTREAEPRVMYTSSMHGDEIAGYPSMLNLINYFITAYKDSGHIDHARIKTLLDNSEVWINPLANPDATYWNSNDNSTVANSRRYNDNGVDLNRNYPAPGGSTPVQGGTFQLETQAFMALAENYHFVIAANFHGGVEVVNYPWDYTYDRHPDDSWWQMISREYADNAQNIAPVGYFDYLNNGITHGADWYKVNGGRQDFMNYEHHSKELTIELSDLKTPPNNPSGSYDILDLWNYNKEAYIDFLIQGTYGFRGIVKDAISGTPINAKISIVGRDDQAPITNTWVETELPLGDFYRPIETGTYNILIESECYNSITLSSKSITDGNIVDLGDILLTSKSATVPANLAASSITTTTATINWDDEGVSSYDIQYRVDGTSDSWTSASSLSNSLDLTGLTLNTTYEFQVRSICLSSSSFSSSSTFTTLVASYCASSGSTSTTGITNVTFNTTNNSDTNNTNLGYEDFTGISTDLDLGNSYSLSGSINTGGNGRNIYVVAWIDFNRDGDFLDSGESFNLGTIKNSTTFTTTSILVPLDATLGESRMRISARYNTSPTSCATSFSGEVEDYTVNIIDSTLGIEDEILSTFQLYPNPVTNGEIKLKIPREISEFNVGISNVLGQKVYESQINDNYKTSHTINTSNLRSGIYFVTVSTNLGKATKKLIIQE